MDGYQNIMLWKNHFRKNPKFVLSCNLQRINYQNWSSNPLNNRLLGPAIPHLRINDIWIQHSMSLDKGK